MRATKAPAASNRSAGRSRSTQSGVAVRMLAWLALTSCCGCGDSTVAVCFGRCGVLCDLAFGLVANAGPDQAVASGDIVTLDGSASDGDIKSYSWTQTGGAGGCADECGHTRARRSSRRRSERNRFIFQLTVVDAGRRAEYRVHARRRASASRRRAVAAPSNCSPDRCNPSAAQPVGRQPIGCPSATVGLAPDAAAAQIGLWLGARTLAIGRAWTSDDPSAFLDAARVLAAERTGFARRRRADRVLGFALLGGLLSERDPALREAIRTHRSSAQMPERAKALLAGSREVRDDEGIAIESVDPALGMQRAVAALLSSRGRCVAAAHALGLTAASLRVIAAADRITDRRNKTCRT